MSRKTTRRNFLLGTASAVAVAGVAGSAPAFIRSSRAADRPLTVVSWGGSFQRAYREAVWKPYQEKTGVRLMEDTWNGEISKVKAMVETGNVTWDLIVADFAHAIVGCQEGFLVPIDTSGIGDLDDYYPGVIHECGVSVDIVSTIFAYDGANVPPSWGTSRPTSIYDVWDLQKFPGTRGIRKYPKPTLELALMADRVPNDQIYKVLRQPGGIERALAKLDEIKEHSIFWSTNAEPPQLLARGEIVLTQAFNGRIAAANQFEDRKFVIIWDHGSWNTDTLLVVKGPNVDKAMDLVEYQVQPEVQARVTNYIPYGPSRKSAMQFVAPEVRSNLPTAPENMKTALSGMAIGEGEDWWADYEQEAVTKFNQWLAA